MNTNWLYSPDIGDAYIWTGSSRLAVPLVADPNVVLHGVRCAECPRSCCNAEFPKKKCQNRLKTSAFDSCLPFYLHLPQPVSLPLKAPDLHARAGHEVLPQDCLLTLTERRYDAQKPGFVARVLHTGRLAFLCKNNGCRLHSRMPRRGWDGALGKSRVGRGAKLPCVDCHMCTVLQANRKQRRHDQVEDRLANEAAAHLHAFDPKLAAPAA